MYIPGKALEVTGEVYVSAKEMVFSYSNVSSSHLSFVVYELPANFDLYSFRGFQKFRVRDERCLLKIEASISKYHLFDNYLENFEVRC